AGHRRRVEEEALIAAALAAGDDLGAMRAGIGDETLHRVEPPRIGERPHLGVGLEAVAELDRLGVIGKARQEALEYRLLHEEPRRRDADLAGVAELARGCDIGRLLRIDVAEYDDRRMSAELHGRPLHAVRPELRHM